MDYKTLFKILSLIAILSCFNFPVMAYRPFITEDAGVAGSGVAQLEFSYDYIKWNSEQNEGQLLFVPIYGFGERFEFSLEIPYLIHNFSDTGYVRGGGDINCVGKLLVYNQSDFFPAFTVKGVLKTDSGNPDSGTGTGHFDYTLQAVFSEEIKNIVLHGNFGYSIVGHEENENVRDIFLYGAGLDWNLLEKLHLITEVTGNRHPDREVKGHQIQAVLGAIYVLSDMLSFDTAFRAGLTDVSPEWSATLGLTLSYGGD
jgi:hypothetical protein